MKPGNSESDWGANGRFVTTHWSLVLRAGQADSDFADCRKQTTTGTNCEFVIPSLGPTLIFRLLALVPEHESKFLDKINPARGVTNITLKLLDVNATSPDLRISGVVIGDDRWPVATPLAQPKETNTIESCFRNFNICFALLFAG